MEEKKIIKPKAHNITMEGRERLSITGVLEVGSFDDNTIVLNTQMGGLIIKGSNLHINKLSVDDGNLNIEGMVNSCVYTAGTESQKARGLFGKIFK